MPRLIDESYTLRRLARRLGWRRGRLRSEVPPRPVGAKLELTHSCNLRCGFCYTDSPRHTLSRTPDLSDETWLAVADQAGDLGVIEVVVTGGEPLLRRELVFSVLERLARRGIGLTLTTNGWFIDDTVADRLAAVDGLQVNVSIDGATPALHDAARGVPGSWRRAVRAVARLLDRGVRVQVVHVVTPDNQAAFPEFLDQMWTLGVTSVRATPVIESGAAARGGTWRVSRRELRRAVRDFTRSHGDGMRVTLQPGIAGLLAFRDEAAPAALLVRPSGAVLTDSLHPFSYGHAARDGLEVCWQRISAHWRDPEISRWARSLRSHRDIPRSAVVPYVDDEVPVGEPVARRAAGENLVARHADEPVPRPARPADDTGDPAENLARARAEVRSLAIDRPYRLGDVRMSGGGQSYYVRSVATGRVARLNRTAAFLVAVLDGATPADAVERLAAHYPEADRARLERDVLSAGRSLIRRGLLVPAAARGTATAEPAGTADVPEAVAGGA